MSSAHAGDERQIGGGRGATLAPPPVPYKNQYCEEVSSSQLIIGFYESRGENEERKANKKKEEKYKYKDQKGLSIGSQNEQRW